MSALVGHVVRRGVQASSGFYVNGEKVEMPELPAWGKAIIFTTIFAFFVLSFAVSHSSKSRHGTSYNTLREMANPKNRSNTLSSMLLPLSL